MAEPEDPPPVVAIVSPYPPGGVRHGGYSGVASYTANLADALAGRGAQVHVVAPEEPGEPADSRAGSVRVHRAFRRGPAAVPAALRAARATGADVVHLQLELFLYGGPSALPGLAAALAVPGGPPTVVTMHQVVRPADVTRDYTRMHRVGAPVPLARAGISGVQALVGRLADRVIVHEPSFAATVPGAAVVPHGVEEATTPPRAAARARLGLDERLVVLCFGFLAPYKGLETAGEAARVAGDAVRLVVAGGDHPRLAAAGDDYAHRLRARYADVADFTGRVPDAEVASWFAAADLALFPYPRPHASSGALALAYAHGTPVLLSPALAATVGGPPELTAPAEPAELGGLLRALAADPAALARLARATRGLAEGRGWSRVADRHLDVYREVSRAQRTRGRRVRAA